jgi:hypothetical protein
VNSRTVIGVEMGQNKFGTGSLRSNNWYCKHQYKGTYRGQITCTTYLRRLSSCLCPSSRRRAWSASPAGGLFSVMVRRGRAAPCRRGREDRGVGLLSLASCDAANKSRRQCPAWTLWWARASDAESELEIRQWQSYLLIDES